MEISHGFRVNPRPASYGPELGSNENLITKRRYGSNSLKYRKSASSLNPASSRGAALASTEPAWIQCEAGEEMAVKFGHWHGQVQSPMRSGFGLSAPTISVNKKELIANPWKSGATLTVSIVSTEVGIIWIVPTVMVAIKLSEGVRIFFR